MQLLPPLQRSDRQEVSADFPPPGAMGQEKATPGHLVSEGESTIGSNHGPSLVVQWLFSAIPMQGAQVWSLVKEPDPHPAAESPHTASQDLTQLRPGTTKYI